MGILILTLIPLMFISNVQSAFIAFFFMRIGFAGVLLFVDLTITAIIDADELTTGIRREASNYGINTFISRFSTILMFISINSVFNPIG